MRRLFGMIVYGVAGVAVAVGLTLGGSVLAGKDLGTPAGPVKPVSGRDLSRATPTAEATPSDDASETPSPGDDRDDERDDEDDRDDNSGSGSSGSGDDEDDRDDNSGSGSDSSGSGSGGSDDSHDDD